MRFPEMDDLGPIFRIVTSIRKCGHEYFLFNTYLLLLHSAIYDMAVVAAYLTSTRYRRQEPLKHSI